MHILNYLKTKTMYVSRKRKIDHFYSLFSGRRILDVGVSGENSIPGINYILENFKLPSQYYTGIGIEDLSKQKMKFPNMKFIQYDGVRFPIKDKSFDWIYCNAVIEHVGNFDSQLFFINEMNRISKNIFLTTPNRYFPIESHTNVLLLHWFSDDIFFNWCRKKNSYWNNKNLALLSLSNLTQLFRKSNFSNYKIFKNKFLGFTMTFTVVSQNNFGNDE